MNKLKQNNRSWKEGTNRNISCTKKGPGRIAGIGVIQDSGRRKIISIREHVEGK